MQVKLGDIAKKLDISIVAVSKALNDKDGISQELKELVKKTAYEMGYDKEVLKRQVSNGMRNILVIISGRQFSEKNMTSSFYLTFYKEIAKELLKNNMTAILYELDEFNEKNAVLPKVYLEGKIQGVIVLGNIRKIYLAKLFEEKIAKVYVDFYNKDYECHSVTTDNIRCSYDITKYLIELGHREIGFVGSINSTTSIQDRYLGYTKAMLENKLDVNKDFVLDDRNIDSEYIEPILPQNLPTAFVCNSDRAAYALYKQLEKRGLVVGKDISVTGFDNDIFSRICEPNLTTIQVSIVEMSKKSVEIMINLLGGSQKELLKVSVGGLLITRESCGECNK